MRRRDLLMGACALFFRSTAARAKDRSAGYAMKALETYAGRRTSLGHAAGGRRLVVVVMKGNWCRVCLGQLARLEGLRSSLEQLGARVVGVAIESRGSNEKAASEAGLATAILSDPKHAVTEALGLWLPDAGHPMPAIVVFDRCGVERARLVGRRPGERPERELMRVLERLAKHPARCRTANA